MHVCACVYVLACVRCVCMCVCACVCELCVHVWGRYVGDPC